MWNVNTPQRGHRIGNRTMGPIEYTARGLMPPSSPSPWCHTWNDGWYHCPLCAFRTELANYPIKWCNSILLGRQMAFDFLSELIRIANQAAK